MKGRASGKLILCGEHAVVYGHPAIAFAVDRGTEATVAPGEPDTGDERLDRALRAIAPGHSATFTSTLPLGRGMGSSAALAVAVVRALHPDLAPDDVFERAMPAERVFHGTPSGIDVGVAAHGGVVRYVRGEALVPLGRPDWRVVVLDSGRTGDTRQLVEGVRQRRPGIDPVLQRIGDLVGEAEAVLYDPARLGPLLDENHELLRRIGVSTPQLDALVQLARDGGALGAKLSGAGGGGVVVALVDDPAPVLAAATDAGIAAWETGIG